MYNSIQYRIGNRFFSDDLMAATNTGGYTAEYDLPNQSNSTNYVYNEIGELIENKQENQGFEYNASGLTTRVYDLATDNNIATFTYNDKGLRHSKINYTASNMPSKATYYSYDAGGTLLAMYTIDLLLSDALLEIQNYTIFGAGRLGIYDMASHKVMYELSDHLGNTRAVVAADVDGNAETVSYTDYYPHGGVMPGRNYVNSLNFPFAYQGQEKDAETNLINFELRQYDARLGRWYNPDPMGQHHSPYLSMSNNPVSFTDVDGGWDSDDGFIPYSPPPLQDNTWVYTNPWERRQIQSQLGTSYEAQQKNRILDNASLGNGYRMKDGGYFSTQGGKISTTYYTDHSYLLKRVYNMDGSTTSTYDNYTTAKTTNYGSYTAKEQMPSWYSGMVKKLRRMDNWMDGHHDEDYSKPRISSLWGIQQTGDGGNRNVYFYAYPYHNDYNYTPGSNLGLDMNPKSYELGDVGDAVNFTVQYLTGNAKNMGNASTIVKTVYDTVKIRYSGSKVSVKVDSSLGWHIEYGADGTKYQVETRQAKGYKGISDNAKGIHGSVISTVKIQ